MLLQFFAIQAVETPEWPWVPELLHHLEEAVSGRFQVIKTLLRKELPSENVAAHLSIHVLLDVFSMAISNMLQPLDETTYKPFDALPHLGEVLGKLWRLEHCFEDLVKVGHVVVVLVRRSAGTVLLAAGECEGSAALVGAHLSGLNRVAAAAQVQAFSDHELGKWLIGL